MTEINFEFLTKRLEQLQQQLRQRIAERDQAIANINAVTGAIQECEQTRKMFAMGDEPQAGAEIEAPPDPPEGKPLEEETVDNPPAEDADPKEASEQS